MEKPGILQTTLAAIMVITAGGSSLVNRDAAQGVTEEIRALRADMSEIKYRVFKLEGMNDGSK